MKGTLKKLLTVLVLLLMFEISLFAGDKTEVEKELGLSKKLQYETARVLKFKDNKAVLDEIYSLDWYIKVSNESEQYLQAFREDINQYMSIAIKRERLQYIYDQQKSRSLAAAVPNVLSVATMALSSGDWKKAVIAVAGTALNSITSYVQTKKNAELELLQSQWELDDEARNTFNNLQTSLYSHLANMARNYSFENEDFASNQTLMKFVERMNEYKDDPIETAIICKQYEKELSAYPEFWSTLAIAMYEMEEYSEALECIARYEDWYEQVFYHDNDYTHLMLIKAYCMDATIDDPIERTLALEEVVSNIVNGLGPESDWVPQYYCYLVYLDLAEYTKNDQYLEKAWNLLFSILNYNIDQYAKNLKSYFSFDYLESGKNEIQKLIDENNKSIADYKEQKKSAKTKAKKDNIDIQIDKLEEKNSELNTNIKQLEKSIKTETPPTESFLISLSREFMNLSSTIHKKETSDYNLIMKKLSNNLEDDFFRINYLGNNSVLSNGTVDAKFDDNRQFLFFGTDIDAMTFSVPLCSFTFISDDFTNMILHFENERMGIDIPISFCRSESSETGWSYEVVRPTNEEPNMRNTMIKFTVRFNNSFERISIEKDQEIPSLFVSFEGDDNPLSQTILLSFDANSMKELKRGLFDIK